MHVASVVHMLASAHSYHLQTPRIEQVRVSSTKPSHTAGPLFAPRPSNGTSITPPRSSDTPRGSSACAVVDSAARSAAPLVKSIAASEVLRENLVNRN